MTGAGSEGPAPSAVDPTAPYAGFEGTVGKIFSTSEPHWPEPSIPPAGAPNVIVMMADDLGYSDLGCYGSEIDTPELDRLAAEGLRYTDFHVNPMCSPTRASLLTGLNHHMAGMATVPHTDPGFPGYAHELRDNAVTIAEAFRGAGWATFIIGKWHLTKDAHLSDGAPKASWPLQRGFDRFYGILDAFTNFHQPHRLCADNHHIDVDDYPDGYYFTDDLTEKALRMVDELRSSHPTRPGTPTLERWRSQQLIFQKSFDIDVALRWQPGDSGVLVAHGDQGGGYMLYVEDDRLLFAHNAYGDMTVRDAGRSTRTSWRRCSRHGTGPRGPTRCTPSTRATRWPGSCARRGAACSRRARPACVWRWRTPGASGGTPVSASTARQWGRRSSWCRSWPWRPSRA